MAHCNSSGQWQWATAAPLNLNLGNANYYTLPATSIAPNGDVVMAGLFLGTAAFGTLPPLVAAGSQAYFVARLNGQTGQWLWASQASITTTALTNTVNAIALAPNGNVVVTGSLNGTVTFGTLPAQTTAGTNLLVASLNATAGQWQWAARASHTGTGKGLAVAITSTGDVVVAGQVAGPVAFGTLPQLPGTGGTMVVAGLAGSTGQWQWATQTGGPYAQANALALTATDDVVLAGQVSDTLRIGNLPREPFLGIGSFVAKMNARGGPWRWQAVAKPVMRSGGFAWNFANALYLSLTAADEPLVSGSMSSLVSFGSNIFLLSETIPPTGLDYPSSSFVAKLAAVPLATTSVTLSAQTQLYPNPATGSFTLRLAVANPLATSVTLLNSLGQSVRRQAIPALSQSAAIDVVGLTPGLYTLLLPLRGEIISRRVTVE
ncbi:T9SS type A sorting domain-containing protein [Hymenobacter sp. UYAg731]